MQPAPRCVQATGRVLRALPAPGSPASGIGRPERLEAQATPSVPRHAPRLTPPPPARLLPGPHPPAGATPKERDTAALLRRRGWEARGVGGGNLRLGRERGSGRADRVGDPAPGRCRAPEPFGLTTGLSSGSSCNGKCQGGFFASSRAIENGFHVL